MDGESEIKIRITSLDTNTVFDLLSNQHRRYVLTCLSEHGSLALADLAEEVTRHERDAPIADIPEEDILRVYSSLWHAHIPKLAEAGVVTYDQDRDLVWPGENEIIVETPSTDPIMKPSETDTELLTTAVERGFFKVPRKVPLVEIADTHDISDKEASERLRTELDAALREYLDEFDATAATEEE